ncbi:1-acyl-sn-glycerol-3-phosphate acyltransferase [Patescibacteria group bacterium]|nr:1-acyl-sn-glycerol-3-phosphate acyltransferase [Patescibacteria group bacterium]MBU1890063.1 1-acyl-sn-glycerol-3-phosphate acyltransferase [Patescibacteria group bacterium]
MKPYWFLRLIIGRAVKRYTKCITGMENIPAQGPFLIAVNHTDWLDGLYLMLLISEKTNQKINIVTKSKNYYIWFPGLSIYVDKKNRSRAIDCAVEKLKKGGIVTFFPEGRRQTKEELGQGKTGLVRAALRAQVPILPVGLRCPGHWAFLISLILLLFRSKRLEMHIGQPMNFSQELHQDDSEELIRRASKKVMLKIAKLANKKYIY